MPVVDVIRAAMAEIEDYRRVTVLTTSEDAVAAPAVADMIHLLAELIENATMFSPSGTRSRSRRTGWPTASPSRSTTVGSASRPAQLAEINQQLAEPPDFDLANADRLGLFVGAKLRRPAWGPGLPAPVPIRRHHRDRAMPNSIIVLVSASAAQDTAPLPRARQVTGGRPRWTWAPTALRADRQARGSAVLPGRAQPGTPRPCPDHQAEPGTRGQPGAAPRPPRTPASRWLLTPRRLPRGPAGSAAHPGRAIPPPVPSRASTVPPARRSRQQPVPRHGPARAVPAHRHQAAPAGGRTGQQWDGGTPRGLPRCTRQASLLRICGTACTAARCGARGPVRRPHAGQARDLAASLTAGGAAARTTSPSPPMQLPARCQGDNPAPAAGTW